MSQRRQPRKPSKEPTNIRAARTTGRYTLAAAVIGSLISVILAAALTNGFGLITGRSSSAAARGEPAGPPVRIDYITQEPSPSGYYSFSRSLMLTTGQLQSLNSLTTGSGYDSWFQSRGAVDVGASVLKIVLQGNRTFPVQVINMSAVKNCTSPYRGTLFENSPSGGAVDDLGVALNLDVPDPFPQDGLMAGNYFNAHTVSLDPGESQTVVVVVNSATLTCSYTLTLTVVANTKSMTETITNHGRPFQIAGLLGLCKYKVLYIGGTTPGVIAPFKRQNPASSSCIPV
jgi:hypothetical protein